jgi:hypothetical protein
MECIPVPLRVLVQDGRENLVQVEVVRVPDVRPQQLAPVACFKTYMMSTINKNVKQPFEQMRRLSLRECCETLLAHGSWRIISRIIGTVENLG